MRYNSILMGNLCSNPSELIQKLKSNRSSVDSLDMILQRRQDHGMAQPSAESIKEEQRDLANMYQDAELRKQFMTKVKYENKIKHRIDAINNLDGFDFNGDIACTHKPNSRLLNAKVEVNKSKNVYAKQIGHHPESPDDTISHVAISSAEIVSKEVGYYTK